MRNLKLAVRTLFKTPFVTVIAVLSLALGIGANAAIYSLFNMMLLKPLPVAQPARLLNFAAPGPQYGSNSCNQAGDCDEVFSYPMFRDLEKANTAFSGIAGHYLFGVNVAMAGQTPVNGDGVFVSGSYFPVLGVHPALGRLLTPNDDQTLGGHYVTVVSHAYWETQLGSNPAVINQQITINGKQMTIVGVAPKDFTGTTLGARPYVFVPMTMRAQMNAGWTGFERRDSYWVYLFGRLKAGATADQARSSANNVYHSIINDVEAPQRKGMSAKTMTEFRAKKILLADGRKGQSSTIKESKTPLLLLFAITAIVLLISCANIANLLLARAANRAMEMAVRLSLGATRPQLIVQVLTESVLLASLGGLVSIVVAHWTLGGITVLLPAEVASTMEFSLSVPVLLFTAALSLGTGLVFGIVPAMQSTRPDLVTELRNNSGKLSGGRGAARFRTSLVTVQIALSMALLISAGLFIKSLRNISRVDLGVKIDNVVTFGVSPARSGYDTTRAKALYGRIEDAMAAIPGVSAVSSSVVPLLAGNNWGEGVSVEGFKKDADTDAGSRFNAVGAGYFHLLGVPLLAGREFTTTDDAGSMKVVVVNEAFAKKFNLGSNAVGKHMSMGSDSLDMTIIGLVKDSKYSEVKDKIPPVFVLPYRQAGRLSTNVFYLRTNLPPQQIMRSIPAVMKNIDPNLPLERLKLLPQQVEENVFMDRMISTLSAAFAVLATILAAVGLYGVLAYSVAQRTREIGVRMALGADGGRVRGMVLKQVGMMTLVGGVAGIAGAIALGRAAQSLLFELKGYDPAVMAFAVVALALVAFGAGFIPALRASRIDPMQALRYE
ncbi:MAG: ABC transporter permease [bacterium]